MLHGAGICTYKTWSFIWEMLVNIPAPWSIWVLWELLNQWPFQKPNIWDILGICMGIIESMAMAQEPIDWRYLPCIRPIAFLRTM